MSKQDVEDARQALRRAQLDYAQETAEPEICAICGADFDEGGYLIEFTVIVNHGEEGYQEVTQRRCPEHDGQMLDALRELGFVTHEHGSTTLLVAEDCPGETASMDQCPTPTVYGPVTVLPDGKTWQHPDLVD